MITGIVCCITETLKLGNILFLLQCAEKDGCHFNFDETDVFLLPQSIQKFHRVRVNKKIYKAYSMVSVEFYVTQAGTGHLQSMLACGYIDIKF